MFVTRRHVSRGDDTERPSARIENEAPARNSGHVHRTREPPLQDWPFRRWGFPDLGKLYISISEAASRVSRTPQKQSPHSCRGFFRNIVARLMIACIALRSSQRVDVSGSSSGGYTKGYTPKIGLPAGNLREKVGKLQETSGNLRKSRETHGFSRLSEGWPLHSQLPMLS